MPALKSSVLLLIVSQTFPWAVDTEPRFKSHRLAQIKFEFFHASMSSLLRLGAFPIHPDNNAWSIIVYTLREMIMLPKQEFKTMFKMIPLVCGQAYTPFEGWAHIPSDTKYAAIIFENIDEGDHSVTGRGLIDMEDGVSSCTFWHPMMLIVPESLNLGPKLYMKARLVHN